jgi:hypothetical protein
MQISRSLKKIQEDLEDSEESGDSANYEGLEAFGGPRGLTVPSQYWQGDSIQIEASVAGSYEFLESRGFITKRKKRPTPNDSVLGHEYHHVVAWYHKVSIGLLEFYAWCDNYQKVKAIVNYHLQWSLIHTFCKKHKWSSSQIIKEYRKNLIVTHDGKQRSQHLGKNLLVMVQSIPIINRSPVYKNENGQVPKGCIVEEFTS